MKILNASQIKVLKVCHILFGVMWIGGVMALVSIMLGTHPDGHQQIYMAARDHLIIDKWFLIPGGLGIVITSLVYSIFTGWGFRKFRWIEVKWILTVLLVIIGKAYMGVLIEKNMLLADEIINGNGSVEQFHRNVTSVSIAGIVQLAGFMFILFLSVFKPWTKRNHQVAVS